MVALFLFIVARSLFNLFKHRQGCVISDHCAWLWPPVEDPGPGVPTPPALRDDPGHLRPGMTCCDSLYDSLVTAYLGSRQNLQSYTAPAWSLGPRLTLVTANVRIQLGTFIITLQWRHILTNNTSKHFSPVSMDIYRFIWKSEICIKSKLN